MGNEALQTAWGGTVEAGIEKGDQEFFATVNQSMHDLTTQAADLTNTLKELRESLQSNTKV